jgi:hypothetical protein
MARVFWTLLLVCSPVLAGAQSLDRGEIRGTVYDTTGAAIPNVDLTLRSDQTGFERMTQATTSGQYVFAQIPPGLYRITAEFGGFSPTTISDIRVNVGSQLTADITMAVAGQTEVVTVAAAAGVIDTSAVGISQLISAESVENLPLPGRDYRDLAQLSSSAQVVPGLRGGIRLGGQQSDYAGLVIDGADSYDNFFGEFFGSLETKNFTIPLDAVQEFQVVTNGFAPEFGRATGGLLNVVTKSGTNEVRGSGHYFFRGAGLASDDALGVPSNIDEQHQFGASVGFPLVRDRQFLFFAFDRQLQNGPLVTNFGQDVSGVAVPEYGITDLASLEGESEQFQNLLSFLGRYDNQLSNNHTFSVRSFFTRNSTDGFTGGRGQNEIQAAFDNTENFKNQGLSSVFTLNSVFGASKANELKVSYSYETRPRFANSENTEVQINDTGNFGRRFFLPINGDNEKLQIQNNFVYVFGNHDMKFGGDINAYALRKNVFIGWQRGTYVFDTLQNFQDRNHIGFIQGFGLNGVPYEEAATVNDRQRQTGTSLYVQDKWQVKPNLSITYGLRWDGTNNPSAISGTPGQRVYVGEGGDSRLEAPLQEPPDDYGQWGPRVSASYRLGVGSNHPSIIRAAWGLYYAQSPTIFIPTGSGRTAVLFCFFNATCVPEGGFPNLFPDSLQTNDPLLAVIGNPGINYIDPEFRNPRVSNTTIGYEYQIAQDISASVTYAYSHSDFLRTGGFSSTIWERNVVVDHVDEFGRSILAPQPRAPFVGPTREDPTIGSANSLGSFGRGNFHQLAFNVTKRFSDNYQFFVNYAWSQNRSSASSERDTETFFGPQDPFNIELDYGKNALDVPHQFKFAGVAQVAYGLTLSASMIARSGVPYPAYILEDINGDGVSNQGVGSNDRPVVTQGGNRFLLERYPARQPSFFQLDFRVAKDFVLQNQHSIEVLAEFFNLFNNDNLFSNPNISAFVPANLTKIPEPGDPGANPGSTYRVLDQISPGSTPFAVQLGVRYSF